MGWEFLAGYACLKTTGKRLLKYIPRFAIGQATATGSGSWYLFVSRYGGVGTANTAQVAIIGEFF